MSHLPDSIWSPEDLTELIADLKHYNQWLTSYQIKQQVTSGAPSPAAPTLSPAAIACLHDLHAKKALNNTGVEALITSLMSVQNSSPRIDFTLAAPPANGLKKSFVAWCRTNISPDALVSFQFNASLLGGMVVRYKSHIFDWSFRRQILANRNKFAEILRNV